MKNMRRSNAEICACTCRVNIDFYLDEFSLSAAVEIILGGPRSPDRREIRKTPLVTPTSTPKEY